MGSWARCLASTAAVSLVLALPHVAIGSGPSPGDPPPGWERLPDPEGSEWVPPLPPPPPKEDAKKPGKDAKPTLAVDKKRRMGRAGRGLRISGIVFTSLGLVGGVVTLVSFMQAQKALRDLEHVSEPQFQPDLREDPLAEINRWNPITVATGIGAGAAGAVGISLLVAGIVRGYRGPRDRRKAWILPTRRGAVMGWSF